MVSLMVYSSYIYRLMTQKLPRESLRPAMFISVGPSGFTISGVINMGATLPDVVPENFMGEGLGKMTGQISAIMANWVGLWLWGLAIWFFCVSVAAHFTPGSRGKMHFAMNWYSFIFPNTALTTSTFAVARALGGNRQIQIVGAIMTVALIITWLCVFGMMIRAIIIKQVLWPELGEDRNEGGWRKSLIGNKGEQLEEAEAHMDASQGIFPHAEEGYITSRENTRSRENARRPDSSGGDSYSPRRMQEAEAHMDAQQGVFAHAEEEYIRNRGRGSRRPDSANSAQSSVSQRPPTEPESQV